MARFYGSMSGGRAEVTRTGSKNNGIQAHLRGWDVGIQVFCEVNEKGEDVCNVYLTSGSNHSHKEKFIGSYTQNDLK